MRHKAGEEPMHEAIYGVQNFSMQIKLLPLPSPQDTEDGCRPQHNDVLGLHHNLEKVCSNLTD